MNRVSPLSSSRKMFPAFPKLSLWTKPFDIRYKKMAQNPCLARTWRLRRRRDSRSFASNRKVPPRSIAQLRARPNSKVFRSSGVWTGNFVSIVNHSSRSWLQPGCSSNCKDVSHLWAPVRTDDTSQLLDLVEAQHAMQTGALSPDAALCRIVGLALKLVPAHGAGVWLFAGDAFVYRAGTGTASDDEGLRTAVLSRLEGGEPSDESHPDGDMAQGTPFKSLLVAPIHQGPKVVGAFAVFSENAHGFSARDVTSARLLTGLVAHAVDKAASARFEHIVSLERAVVLHVIEDLVPTLAGLASQETTCPPSPAVPAASVEAPTAAALSVPSFVPGEAGNETHAETLAALVEEVETFKAQPHLPEASSPWLPRKPRT